MYWLPYSSHTSCHPSQTPCLPWISYATQKLLQDAQNAVWSIPYVSVTFFPSLKHNFIAYHSSKVFWRPDCIFEIHQLWQSGFSRVYSNSCCSGSFKPEILKIGQSSHKMYSKDIVNSQESMTILNACTKKSGKLLNAPHIYVRVCEYIYIYIYIYMFTKYACLIKKRHWLVSSVMSFCWVIAGFQVFQRNTLLASWNPLKIFNPSLQPKN